VVVVLLVRRQASRLVERAERAYPGLLDGPARRQEPVGSARPGNQPVMPGADARTAGVRGRTGGARR